MFYLSKIEHTLRLPPHLLSPRLDEAIKGEPHLDEAMKGEPRLDEAIKAERRLVEAIKGELEIIFLDKVIANLGLCISVYEISDIQGGFIFPDEGASTYTVTFKLIVFRPFVGEIIVAKLKESNKDGLRLSLGFFDDIYIPNHHMAKETRCVPDPTRRYEVRWIWEYNAEQFPIDGADEIKFQVTSVKFPSIPIEQTEGSKPFAPMVITGSINMDGLGPVSWWQDAEALENDAD